MNKIKQALIGFLVLISLYIGALFFIQNSQKNQTYDTLVQVWHSLPVLILLTLSIYCLRFLRWQYLLTQASYSLPLKADLLAYMSGYALTASPGKVGELIRIRYYLPLGVPAHVVVSAFVFERAFDLISVLVLASLYVGRTEFFILLLCFVLVFLIVVIGLTFQPKGIEVIELFLKKWRFNRLASIVETLKNGIKGARVWINPKDCTVAMAIGLFVWTISALSFVYLLSQLQIQMPWMQAFAAYPLAMLAGAASMIPAGVGSVEVVLIGLLTLHQVPFFLASMAALGIRISAIWTAILLGIFSLLYLEWRTLRKQKN